MSYLIALILFSLPVILCSVYSSKEYDLSFSDNLENWVIGKYTGIALFFTYSVFVLCSGDLDNYLFEFWFYFIEPSVSIALIIFSKPASELLSNYADYFSVGIHEDMGFILGWLGLLHVLIITTLELV